MAAGVKHYFKDGREYKGATSGLDSKVSQVVQKVQLVTIPLKLVMLRTLPKVRCQQLTGPTKLNGNT